MLLVPEVLAPLGALHVQLGRGVGDELVEVGVLQDLPDVLVAVRVERVQVHPQGPREQNRFLESRRRNSYSYRDGKTASEGIYRF